MQIKDAVANEPYTRLGAIGQMSKGKILLRRKSRVAFRILEGVLQFNRVKYKRKTGDLINPHLWAPHPVTSRIQSSLFVSFNPRPPKPKAERKPRKGKPCN